MILGLMAFGASAQAQQSDGGKGRQGQYLDKMRTELGLSETQVAQMEALKTKYQPQVKAIWADESLDQDAKMAKMKEIREAKKTDMQAILTPAQMEKMKTMHAEGGRHGGHHGDHAGFDGHGEKGHHGEFKERKGGVHAELQPIMLRQRAKFESQLTAADKAEIVTLRTKMDASRVANKSFHQEMRQLRQTETAPTEAEKAKMQEMRKAHRALEAEVLTIAKRYDSQLKALHEEVRPEVEAIMAKHHADRPAGNSGKCEGENAKCTKGADGKCTNEEGSGSGSGEARKPHGGHHAGKGHGQDRMLVHFMLMDPNATGKSAQSGNMRATRNGITVFPNPSAGSNTLQYELEKEANVKVELLSINGQVLRVLDEGRKTAGTQTLQVSLSDLTAGIYFYRISGDVETQQRRFSVTE